MNTVTGLRLATIAGIISLAAVATNASAPDARADDVDRSESGRFDVDGELRRCQHLHVPWHSPERHRHRPLAGSRSRCRDLLGRRQLKSVGANVGTWNSLHTGDAGQDGPTALGDTTKAFNGGDSSRVIGSVGIGFTY